MDLSYSVNIKKIPTFHKLKVLKINGVGFFTKQRTVSDKAAWQSGTKCNITDQQFMDMRRLEDLYLNGNTTITHVPNFSLKKLSIQGTSVMDPHKLSMLTQLSSLNLSRNTTIRDLTFARYLLELDVSELSTITNKNLNMLTTLTWLSCSNCPNVTNLDSLTNLIFLNMANCQLDTANIRNLSKLKSLNMKSVLSITTIDFAPDLEYLNIDNTNVVSTGISKLTRLTCLSMALNKNIKCLNNNSNIVSLTIDQIVLMMVEFLNLENWYRCL